MDTFSFIVALLLVFFVMSDLLAAILLQRGAARSDYSLIALNERAFVATVQGISGTILGILGANRIIGWHLPAEIVLTTLSIAVILQATPSIMWLYLYYRHKFGG